MYCIHNLFSVVWLFCLLSSLLSGALLFCLPSCQITYLSACSLCPSAYSFVALPTCLYHTRCLCVCQLTSIQSNCNSTFVPANPYSSVGNFLLSGILRFFCHTCLPICQLDLRTHLTSLSFCLCLPTIHASLRLFHVIFFVQCRFPVNRPLMRKTSKQAPVISCPQLSQPVKKRSH